MGSLSEIIGDLFHLQCAQEQQNGNSLGVQAKNRAW